MTKLSEDEVITGLDIYVQSCLDRMASENMIGADISPSISSGRAAALFYAAISADEPPSIPILPTSQLNPYTAPRSLLQFTYNWVKLVPKINSLPSRDRSNLARILCGPEPSRNGSVPDPCPSECEQDITSIATELRLLALQLEQRSEFRKRFSGASIFGPQLGRSRTIRVPPVPPVPPIPPIPRTKTPQMSGQEIKRNNSAPPTPSPVSGTSRGVPFQDVPCNVAPPGRDMIGGIRLLPPIPTRKLPQVPEPKPAQRVSQPTVPKPSPKPPSNPLCQPILVRRNSIHFSSRPRFNSVSFSASAKPLSPPPARSSASIWPRIQASLQAQSRPAVRATSPLRSLTDPTAISSIPSPAPSPSPPYLETPTVPIAILTIRETLYAAIAEVLSTYSSLTELFKSDPALAFFTTISLSILSISLSSLSPDGNSIRSVLGTDLGLCDVPADHPSREEGGDYRSFMEELMTIGQQGRKIAEEDDMRAVAYAVRGMDLPNPRMDRLKRILEMGLLCVDEGGEMTVEDIRVGQDNGTPLPVALRIHQLAMRVVKMKSLFNGECAEEILEVLAGEPMLHYNSYL